MKIGLCQINPIIGKIDYNKTKILDGYKKGIEQGVDLVILPELALCGYPPQDLIEKEEFRKAVIAATIEIAEQFPNVKVRAFEEIIPLEDGYSRNPDWKHLNFLFEWAEEEGADWIVLDDCDTFPNYLLRRDEQNQQ